MIVMDVWVMCDCVFVGYGDWIEYFVGIWSSGD